MATADRNGEKAGDKDGKRYGKCIADHTKARADVSRAIALQLQKDM
jgi:hypothetical protein